MALKSSVPTIIKHLSASYKCLVRKDYEIMNIGAIGFDNKCLSCERKM